MAKYSVTASALRIRSGPGTNFTTIGMLYKSNIVDGSEISGEWVNITTTDNRTGWSHRAYLELLDETPPPASGATYRVDTSALNFRTGPSLAYTSTGTLKLGELVEGLAVSSDNLWAQVKRSTGAIGWSSLKYLSRVAPPPPPGSTDITMIVTVDLLNFRTGPSDGYPISGQAYRGERVTYLSSTQDWKWVNIRTARNAIGWAPSRSLMEQNDLFASPEDYPATGLHRALSDALSMRLEPNESSPALSSVRFNRVLKVDTISADGKWKHGINAWGESGWYPTERLAKLGDVAIQRSKEEFPWLPIAYGEFGGREIPGPKNNPRIQEYLMSTDLAQKYSSLPDETDWCASFVNWCIKKAGVPVTNSALVSPWRNWGKAAGHPPKRGALTTFLWDDGWGHVSFYLGDIGNYVVCLGGNQGDAVWISVYHKKYVTNYRVY